MKNLDLIKAYNAMRQKTYDAIDKSVFAFLHERLTSSLSLRDLSVLYYVSALKVKKLHKAKEIAQALKISKTNLSNRLERLSKLALIQKQVNPNDKREFFIELTAKGQASLDVYIHIIDEPVKLIQFSYSLADKVKLVRAIEKMSLIDNEAPVKINWLKPQTIQAKLQVMINHIYQRAFNHDQSYLEAHGWNEGLKVFRVFLEIHIQSSLGHCTLNQLHQELSIPLSSLSRFIDTSSHLVLKKEDVKDKRIKYLSIRKPYHALFEDFMSNRLAFYQRSVDLVGRKTFDLVEQLLKILKDFTEKSPSI
jgi:DNA-binding MarR family transcriptional regulator